MEIPFTTAQFFAVFQIYNEAVWPAQIVAYLLGIIVIVLAIRQYRLSGRVISGILALFWMWIGVLYHMIHFSPINPTARIVGMSAAISLRVPQDYGLVFAGVLGTVLIVIHNRKGNLNKSH